MDVGGNEEREQILRDSSSLSPPLPPKHNLNHVLRAESEAGPRRFPSKEDFRDVGTFQSHNTGINEMYA